MRDGMTLSEAGYKGWLASRSKLEELKKERIKRYQKNPTKCKFCLKELEYKKRHNKFCSQSCCACFSNRKRVSKHKKLCLCCQKETLNAKFCSMECQHEFRRQQYKKEVIHTGVVPIPKCGNPRVAKNYLIREKGNVCEVCKNKIWNNKLIPLNIDHINGDPYDHRVDNLRLICPNCDAQTSTYKGKNKGKGRYSRRKRYQDGKSY